MSREDIEIKTYDEVILRGWFYPREPKAPVIIMSSGMAGIKENFLDKFAERFQQAGFAVLFYDNRNWGASDGTPRNHTNHYEQIQDAHDVVTYASKRLDVDESRIIQWGSSFSGGAAIIAGAVDPRIKAVIAQVPFVSGRAVRERLPLETLEKVYADRGHSTALNPSYIPIYPESLEQAREQPKSALLGTEECGDYWQIIKNFKPEKKNAITLQTMFHTIRSEPSAFVDQISPKPFFMAIAGHDSLIDPSLQVNVFGKAQEPKELLKLDCGHFQVYQGEHFEVNVLAQIAFLKKHLYI
ncbi:Alpha/Beta hydrolase protein [Aspergillus caelatus]|uniref:Alpha/Beta hydrolase protein n=1 Tax=Aspergillus caelatus TaxID=61420 RepID=A0A5N6ZPQ8_9EURO|nr:Alpha/Beta hydrolase protein [Aspergillus caelatus]KAE8358946.1 Alpha/Beta hydrolase protein [Aspergillus caelatus]